MNDLWIASHFYWRLDPRNAGRGTCPCCQSEAVIHLVPVEPSQDGVYDVPFWVRVVDEAVPGVDRVCALCDYRWNDRADLRISESDAREAVAQRRGLGPDEFDAWHAPEGWWYLTEIETSEMLIDDAVWGVSPTGHVTRVIPPSNPMHPATDLCGESFSP